MMRLSSVYVPLRPCASSGWPCLFSSSRQPSRQSSRPPSVSNLRPSTRLICSAAGQGGGRVQQWPALGPAASQGGGALAPCSLRAACQSPGSHLCSTAPFGPAAAPPAPHLQAHVVQPRLHQLAGGAVHHHHINLRAALGLHHVAGRQVLGRKVAVAAAPLAELAEVAAQIAAAQVPAPIAAALRRGLGGKGAGGSCRSCNSRAGRASAGMTARGAQPLTGSRAGTAGPSSWRRVRAHAGPWWGAASLAQQR